MVTVCNHPPGRTNRTFQALVHMLRFLPVGLAPTPPMVYPKGMNTKSKVFAQHLRNGNVAYGGTVYNHPKPHMVRGDLIVEVVVDLGEGNLPRFDIFYPLALAIVDVG